MKRGLIYMVLMLLMGARIAAHAQELTVSDIQNSGCMRDREYGRRRANAEGEPTRTIILTKEGDALHVQLLNCVENCSTSGFDVTPSMSCDSDGFCSVDIDVTPIIYMEADCVCPYDVSFTVHGLKANSFFFSCWWCEGLVNLTEGESLVLEDSWESINIGGLNYLTHNALHAAKLMDGKTWEGELRIPSELEYEGQTYIVTRIGSEAFKGNTTLTSVIIPEGVKAIEYYAFYGCTNLASITIPNSVIQIGGSVFNGTAWYDNQPDGVIYAGRMAYTYKGTIPEGTKIDIKEGTIAIADNAFCRCDNLASVIIPSSVTTIGSMAFDRCMDLMSVSIAEGLKNIQDLAFIGCSNLQSINIPQSVERIGEFAFCDCKSLASLVIPAGVVTRRFAFSECTGLTSLVISEGVKSIGYSAFSACNSLTSVSIPGSVQTVCDEAFRLCSGLTSVVISEGVKTIDGGAFYRCSNLTTVSIPKSMTLIRDYAFQDCSNLADVYCYADSVPKTANNWVFYNSPIASATLHVPAGSVDAYRTTSPWSGFGNIVALPIEINETTFPDENFRNWVLANSFGRDGVLTDAEIASVTKLSIGSRRIQSLKGIEFFTETSWLDVGGNGITEIDLSPFPKMTHLDIGWCKIKELDLSKNTALTYLDCRGNGLTTIDLSKNTALTNLLCFSNQLTELDVSQNTLLTEIECQNNLLTELDLSKNLALEELECMENQLTALDVSQHTALKYLTCYNNQLASLDVSGCTAIISLKCNSNQLMELDLTDCTGLISLYCMNNQLTALDVSTNIRLDQLYCQQNNLTKLNVSNNKEIWCLVCYDNQLTELDVSGVTKLYHLHCYRNQLTSLNMSGNPSLINLYCYSNQIKGEAMDELLESMHTIGSGDIYGFRVINSEDEQNVMTKAQVAAARAKGWKPLHHVGGNSWQEYEGSDDPTGITSPLRETEEGAIFDLQGRKVSKPQKGIYIKEGRKVLIK